MAKFESMLDKPTTIIWVAGGSCEGCSMATLGAANPGFEDLLLGQLSGLPPIRLTHPLTAFEAGDAYLERLEQAAMGAITPLILVIEGSIFEPTSAGTGFFSGMGEQNGRYLTITDWLDKLTPQATAVIAIGNPTGAMSLNDYLGSDFRSKVDLPIINIPGCAPPGRNFIETLIYLLHHLNQQVPLELDEFNRLAWLYRQQTRPQPAQVDYHPLHLYQSETAVNCNVPQQG